jgi:predicted dehydrogenase
VIDVETYDTIQVLLDFGEGMVASVATGYTMPKTRGAAVELYGTEGVLQMLSEDWAPDGYELWQSGGDPRATWAAQPWQLFPETDPAWEWTDGLRHLVECLIHDREPLITPEHAYHVLEIMVKAEEAAADGQMRDLTSTFPPLRLDPDSIETDGYVRPGRMTDVFNRRHFEGYVDPGDEA